MLWIKSKQCFLLHELIITINIHKQINTVNEKQFMLKVY